MANTVDFTNPPFVRGEDIEIEFSAPDLGDITGMAFEFNIATRLGRAPFLVLTVGDGITLTDAPASVGLIEIPSAETLGINVERCVYDFWRTDAGERECLSEGEIVFKRTANQD